MSRALILIDVQPDFMPGGALPVAEGDQIVEPIRKLMERDLFDLYIATQDWHPRNHISFASRHTGHKPFDVIELYGHEQVLWPDHCVEGTAGAELHGGIPWTMVSAIIRKGTDADTDSYSGFRNNYDPQGERPPTGLAGYLRERGVNDVVLCGLARDFCVKWSAEDAARVGFGTTVLWDLTRPVHAESDDAVRGDLERAGVLLTASDHL